MKRPRLILAADDYEPLRTMLRSLLGKQYPLGEGFHVSIHESAPLLLRRHRETPADTGIVITDYYFGPNEVNGIELVTRLRDEAYKGPIIGMSGSARAEQHKMSFLAAGADEFLSKPFKPLDFLKAVNSRYNGYLQRLGYKI